MSSFSLDGPNSDKSYLRKERFVLTQSSRRQSTIAGNPWQQELEAGGYMASAAWEPSDKGEEALPHFSVGNEFLATVNSNHQIIVVSMQFS